jgi:putative ABC transport system permease protein
VRFLDILGLARDNLARTKLRTALTATGIAIGTAAVITLLAFGNGIQALAVGQAATFSAVTSVVVGPGKAGGGGAGHPITPASVDQFRGLAHVNHTVVTLSTPPVKITVDGASAVAPGAARTPIGDSATLVAGSGAGTADTDGLLVPQSMVSKFGGSAGSLVGKPATLTIGAGVCCNDPRGGIVYAGPQRTFPAHVAGVYDDTGANAPRDGSVSNLVMAAPLGAQLDGTASSTTADAYLNDVGYESVVVQTDDARATAAVASSIKSLGFQAASRADLLARIDLFFNIIRAGLGMIGGIALVVAAIGIANTLVMTVLERTREIGIMKALGAEPGAVRMIFLVETALVGLIGGLLGLALSALAGVVGNVVFIRIVQSQNPDFPFTNVFVMTPVLVAFGVALAIVVSLLGGALPSRRAVRLQPLDALRYE